MASFLYCFPYIVIALPTNAKAKVVASQQKVMIHFSLLPLRERERERKREIERDRERERVRNRERKSEK